MNFFGCVICACSLTSTSLRCLASTLSAARIVLCYILSFACYIAIYRVSINNPEIRNKNDFQQYAIYLDNAVTDVVELPT